MPLATSGQAPRVSATCRSCTGVYCFSGLLGSQGFLICQADPADARRVLVSLTDSGRARIAPVLTDASAFNLSVLASYSPEVLTMTKDLLKDMIERFPGLSRHGSAPGSHG